MPWKIAFDEQSRIVETTYTGQLSPAEVREAALGTIATGRQYETNLFLGDCLTLEHAGSLFNIYDLIRLYESLELVSVKEAILLPRSPEALNDLKFYETIAQNRGFNVRVFDNRADALRWLLTN